MWVTAGIGVVAAVGVAEVGGLREQPDEDRGRVWDPYWYLYCGMGK